jgi:glyoxylase-like metal-dependent hydrolase (beta-lactamase superfamily II)
MTFERIDVGDLELFALLDADGDLDVPIADAFPGWPDDELLAHADRFPGVYGADGSWRLQVRAWLVNHPGGSILVDTGIGAAGAPGPEWFGANGHLHAALMEVGSPPESIDTVVISHVHDDHIGGTVVFTGAGNTPEPAFPNARHVLQRADLDWARATPEDGEEAFAIWHTLLAPLEDAGLLDAIEGDSDLVEGISLHHLAGHTPGHQVVRLTSGSDRAVICADALMHPAQIPHPQWPTAQDEDGPAAAESRAALLAELAAHPGTVLAPTHFGEAFGEVSTGPDGLASWTPR